MAHTESDAPVVAVIGGSRGIGIAVGRCLLRDGWRVAVADLDPPEADGSADGSDAGDPFHYIRADIADSASVDRLAAGVQARRGRSAG